MMQRFLGVIILLAALTFPAHSFACFSGCGGGGGFFSFGWAGAFGGGQVTVGWGHGGGGGFYPHPPIYAPRPVLLLPPPPPPFFGPIPYGGAYAYGNFRGYGYGAYGPQGGYRVRVRRGLFGVRYRANFYSVNGYGGFAAGSVRAFHPYI
jgi:hypothetical protein